MTIRPPRFYILIGRTPIAVDMDTWARKFGASRFLFSDQITPECRVSTIFLGLDHRYGEGDPVLFETMILGGPLHGEQWRYCTYAQAEDGHAAAVTQARKACERIKSIAEQAGAKGGQ